jgi:hypothetical protein
LSVGVVTATGHVVLSVLLGLSVFALGAVFSNQVSKLTTEGIGGAMVVAGVFYGTRQLVSAKHPNYGEEATRISVTNHSTVRYLAVFGAALSPDVSILPVFALTATAGLGLALSAAIVFALASVAALSLFLLLGSFGVARFLERLPPEYNDTLIGLVIAIVGVYVLIEV